MRSQPVKCPIALKRPAVFVRSVEVDAAAWLGNPALQGITLKIGAFLILEPKRDGRRHLEGAEGSLTTKETS